MKNLLFSLIAIFFAFAAKGQSPSAITGVSAICVGSSSTLSDTTAGGTWGSSNTLVATIDPITGVCNGLTAGTAVITYDIGTGYAVHAVTINALPFPISGPTAVCIGSSITLSDATAGGYWTSSNVVIATIGGGGILTGISPGAVLIQYVIPSGCSVTTTIDVVAPPAPISGGTGLCVGGTTTLSGAGGGTWASSNTLVATIDASTGALTALTVGSTTITYTLGTGCVATKPIYVYGTLASYTVNGGGNYCTGASGVHIGLSGSGIGVSYQLYNAGSPVGGLITGTGFSIDFGSQTATGTYTVVGNPGTSCASTMTGSVTVGTLPTPAVYTMTGGGTGCGGSHIGLSGSDLGINYQLYVGPSAYGLPVPGTGSSIDFGVFSINGTYSASGTNTLTGCVSPMTGSAIISGSPTSYSVTGGGSFCPGGSGVVVGLASSFVGINYQLMLGGSPVGSALAGTGSAINFGPQTTVGTYTVTGTNTSTGCSVPMSGSAIVSASALPSAFVVTGGGGYCTGGTGVHVGLSYSTPGVNYQLFNGGIMVGMILAGTNAALDFGLITTSGIYTVIGTDAATGCTSNMSGSATVALLAGPGSCTGTPSAGIASSSLPSVCMGNSVTLSLTGSISCGTTWQWQSSPDGITWSNIAGATNLSFTTTPTAFTVYQCVVTCTASGLSAASVAAAVAVHSSIYSAFAESVVDTYCLPAHFYIATCSPGPSYAVTTYFGDGQYSTVPLSSGGISSADIYHTYTLPGTYSIRQVLYSSGVAVDSTLYSYENHQCSTFPVKFYIDGNSNCTFDSGESYLLSPITTEIDSNGIPIDTISVVSGLYYRGLGPVGTVYSFKVLSAPGMMTVSCPASGIIYDTVLPTVSNYGTKYAGLTCTPGTSFDFTGSYVLLPGRHMATGLVMVNNAAGCAGHPATVTVTFSPKYLFNYGTPAPDYVSGNTATWNISSLSSLSGPYMITFFLHVPNEWVYPYVWLTPGDTIQSTCTIHTDPGESDTTNNQFCRTDTVKSSYDPNEMTVLPEGAVIACTPLQYTINFENTGNAPAQNIYVMDTLSDNLDLNSLTLLGASAQMNITYLTESGHNVLKFDFPGINLLDSSHHGQCDGLVSFKIKTKPGLTDGTPVINKAGIFFDDNPVVLTNTVNNVIGLGAIQGPSTVCTGQLVNLTDETPNGTWTTSGAHTVVSGIGVVSGITAGPDVITYSVSNACGTRTATHVVTVNTSPATGVISGAPGGCPGSTATLTDVLPGGTWSSSDPGIAGVSPSGLVTGVSVGTAVISYTRSNAGCTASATKSFTIGNGPFAFSITGGGSFCSGGPGVPVMLSGSENGSSYQLFKDGTATGSPIAGTGAALNFGYMIAPGSYTIKGTDTATACSSNMTGSTSIIVNPLPVAYTVTGGGSYCIGGTGFHIFLVGSATGVNYQLYKDGVLTGSSFAGSGSGIDFGIYTGGGVYTVAATDGATTCTRNMSGSALITVNSLPPVFTVTGGGSFCAGGTGIDIGLDNSTTGISYQLYTGGIASGIPLPGTGSALDFGLQTTAGSYTVHAVNSTTSCASDMTGSPAIIVNPLPDVFAIGGGGSYCEGGAGIDIMLGNSDTGVLYQLKVGTTNVGSPVAGTGSAIDFGAETATGTYSVYASNPSTGCAADMAGTTAILVNPRPAPFTVTGGGRFCAGGTGVMIGLDGSQTGIQYQLYAGVVTYGIPAIGTGGALTFDAATLAGTYTVRAVNAVTTCANDMTGSANVIVDPSPAAISGSTSVTVGTISTLTDATPGGAWSSSTPYVATVDPATGQIFANHTGTDTITYALPSGCNAQTVVTVNAITISGIPQITSGGLRVYPNPASDLITIEWQNQLTGNAEVVITDIVGREVMRSQLQIISASGKSQADVSGLKNGIYLLTIRNDDIYYTGKLQIER